MGHTIATAPLTAGGLTVLQVCNSLEALGWQRRDRYRFDDKHLVVCMTN
jgi:hypothetical protein